MVQILSGASRGKSGKVLRIFRDQARVTVEGVNLRIKHTKARRQGQKGQKIEFPAPLHVSNVALVCPKCGTPTRVAMQIIDAATKKRACRRCTQAIE